MNNKLLPETGTTTNNDNDNEKISTKGILITFMIITVVPLVKQ